MPTRTLLFHDVVDEGRWNSSGFDSGDAAIYKFTRRSFEEHLDRLATLGSRPDLVLTGAQSNWMITFDDGGSSALEVIAPALERRGWRGHFFVTTGWLSAPGFLTPAGVRELVSRGHTVGSHSHSHPLAMSSLARTQLLREWEQSAAILSDVLGRPPATASIPGGAYSRAVAEAAAAAGIRALFTSEPTERPWTVGPVTCYGRFTLWRGMPSDAALSLAQGRGAARLRQQISWNAKKVVKATCGPLYREFRRRVLADDSIVNRLRGTALPPSR
jgi:peptidoglycan/xylan/chitin deacetylase (PgdA/CDA1 family)